MKTVESLDLIPREITQTGLSKRALKILTNCDRLIGHYNQLTVKPAEIALFPSDFRHLAEQLSDNEQDINRATYRGYRLSRYG